MAKQFVRENVPLSRFGVLVAQLESIVASAAHKSPDSLLCFDLLSDLISAIEEEPKVILYFVTFQILSVSCVSFLLQFDCIFVMIRNADPVASL